MSVPKPLGLLFLRPHFAILTGYPPAPEGAPMPAAGPLDIAHHFRRVQDPRDPRFITHLLGDILTIALCATLSGAKSFEDIAAFGRA